MKQKRHTTEEITRILAQAQDLFLIASSLAAQQERTDGEHSLARLPASERVLRQGIADQLRVSADLAKGGASRNVVDLAGALQDWREDAAVTPLASHCLLLEHLATRSLQLQRQR